MSRGAARRKHALKAKALERGPQTVHALVSLFRLGVDIGRTRVYVREPIFTARNQRTWILESKAGPL